MKFLPYLYALFLLPIAYIIGDVEIELSDEIEAGIFVIPVFLLGFALIHWDQLKRILSFDLVLYGYAIHVCAFFFVLPFGDPFAVHFIMLFFPFFICSITFACILASKLRANNPCKVNLKQQTKHPRQTEEVRTVNSPARDPK